MTRAVEDRRRDAYLGATSITQAMLDETFRGNENQLEPIGTLTKTVAKTFTVTIATPGVFTSTGHGLEDGDAIVLTTTGALPTGLTAGGTVYVRDRTDDTFRAALTSGGAAINTTGSQSGTHTWTMTRTLRFSDRHKFVGDNFYEGRATFPVVRRTMGELVAPTIQFSQFEVDLANLDGFYNDYLPGGADYFSPIGATLTIQMGLRDVALSFVTLFEGVIPQEDGSQSSLTAWTLRANDKFDALNFPPDLPVINDTDFPDAPDDSLGKTIPMILGDWEEGYVYEANTGSVQTRDSGGTTYDVRTDSPNGFYAGAFGINVGGGYFVFSIGTYTPDTIADCHIKRGETMIKANFNATPQNTAGYWSVQVTSLATITGGTAPYQYQNGDVALVKVKVPYAASKYSNMIELAEQFLFTLGGLVSGDLDATSWSYLKTKSTPAACDMTSIKGRVFLAGQDAEKPVLRIVLQHLEQVRVEASVNRSGKIQLTTLHPDDFPAPASAAARIDKVEVDEAETQIKADDKDLFFNQGSVNFAFVPCIGKTALTSAKKRNAKSIERSGKTVPKVIDLPALYRVADAELQLVEFLRFYSGGVTFIQTKVAWVHLLRDLGEFVAFNFEQGGVDLVEAPCMIRDLAIDLTTGAVGMRLLSFANFSYDGYSPDNAARFLTGADQTIESAE